MSTAIPRSIWVIQVLFTSSQTLPHQLQDETGVNQRALDPAKHPEVVSPLNGFIVPDGSQTLDFTPQFTQLSPPVEK